MLTVIVETPAAVRTGRGLIRNASTSAIVYLPEFRISSATSSRATSQATRNPIEYRKPSYPDSAMMPAMPRNDAADM